jgi:hypothetical protein
MEIPTRETTLAELEKLASSGYVYVVLDACDAPAVPEKVRDMGTDRAMSLYNGTAQEEYWAIAPYLCKADTELLEWIKQSLWADAWGIVAISKADFAAVRAHFRKFLMVQSPEGEYWHFRFYDPRVLPVFLESSTAEEARELFGPIQAFAVAEPGAEKMKLLKAV